MFIYKKDIIYGIIGMNINKKISLEFFKKFTVLNE